MHTDSFDELELLRYWELSVGIGLGKQAWPEVLFTFSQNNDSVVATTQNLCRNTDPSIRLSQPDVCMVEFTSSPTRRHGRRLATFWGELRPENIGDDHSPFALGSSRIRNVD